MPVHVCGGHLSERGGYEYVPRSAAGCPRALAIADATSLFSLLRGHFPSSLGQRRYHTRPDWSIERSSISATSLLFLPSLVPSHLNSQAASTQYPSESVSQSRGLASRKLLAQPWLTPLSPRPLLPDTTARTRTHTMGYPETFNGWAAKSKDCLEGKFEKWEFTPKVRPCLLASQ